MKTIKVIYDLEVIGNTYKIDQSGVYRVAYEILKNFLNNEKLKVLYTFFNFNNRQEIQNKIDCFISENNFIIQQANTCERVKFIPFRKEKPFRKLYNKVGIFDFKIKFNEEIKDSQIYHSLYYPIHKSLDQFPKLKKVVTIHDLIPILFPHYNANTDILEKTIRSIGKDNYAICVSENTKRDLLKYAPYINPDKVFVSLLAASSDLFYKCDDKIKFAEIKRKYNIPDKYFLSLSTLEPRKNIDHVIRSFIKMITEKKVDDLSLVLVGKKGWDFEKIFQEYENAKELKSRIIITGRIPDDDLACIYSNANSFYYMSFYEGFGLPPLEAMQCGLPSVVSNTSSLPEVVGDAGILLDPKDQLALTQNMWKLYSDENYRSEMSLKSIEQSKKFSWEATVQQHVDIYRQIILS